MSRRNTLISKMEDQGLTYAESLDLAYILKEELPYADKGRQFIIYMALGLIGSNIMSINQDKGTEFLNAMRG